MKNFILFFFLIFPLSVLAQFGEVEILESSLYSYLEVVDLDDDEDLDIISATRSGLYWHENIDGNETYERIRIFSSEELKEIADEVDENDFYLLIREENIKLVDIDKDQDLDIMWHGYWLKDSINTIAWLMNNGAGEFSVEYSQIILPQNEEFTILNINFADFNQDGIEDMLIDAREKRTHYSSSFPLTRICWGDSNGNYKIDYNWTTITQGTEWIASQIIDINGDTFMDIVSSSNSGTFWFENDGLGIFNTKHTIDEEQFFDFFQYDDIDSDGHKDLIVGFFSSYGRYNIRNELLWYKNNGNNEFNISGEEYYDLNMHIARSTVGSSGRINIELIDVDSDGDLDVYGSRNDEDWYMLFESINQGDGTFVERATIQGIDEGIGSRYALAGLGDIADLDEDGNQDGIAIVENELVWFKGDSMNNVFDTIILQPSVGIISSIDAKDLDGDEDADVVVFSEYEGKLSWFENQDFSDKRFEQHMVFEDSLTAREFTLTLEYIDEDNILDIAARGRFWYRGLSNGEFEEVNSCNGDCSYYFGAVWGHFNEDEYIDYIVYRHRENTLDFYWNNGNGNFVIESYSAEDLNFGISSIEKATIENIDNDEFKDLIVVSSKGRGVWIEQDSTYKYDIQNFKFLVSGNSFFIDVDNDGDNDIVRITEYDSHPTIYVDVWLNDGTGAFEKVPSNSSYTYKFSDDRFGVKEVLDINDDGIPEILGDGGGLKIYSLEGELLYTNGDFCGSSMKILDLDQDGKLDILSGCFRHEIMWLKSYVGSANISGSLFIDENENGIKDSSEALMQNTIVDISPDAISSFTDRNGTYKFFLPNGSYTLTPQVPDNWRLTTDSASYTIDVLGNLALNKDFGFAPDFDARLVQSYLTSSPTRCGFDVNFWLDYENNGSQREKGQIALILDERVDLLSTMPAADERRGDTLFWNYSEFSPTYTEKIALILGMPGVDNIGDTLQMEVHSYIKNENEQLQLTDIYDFASVIRCAYDPNDKLVLPNRSDSYDKNYTLFEEMLEYTVRFQNTGTDTAFTVIIRDSLDINLDWTSFKPISASHDFETTLDSKSGLVAFTFSDILLPDSTTNEPASHGYVKYKIKQKKGIDENTQIENTANIFFDFNPPIRTNTVENTFVSELPKTPEPENPITNFEVKAYPNPFGDFFTIVLESETNDSYYLRLINVNGQIFKEETIPSNGQLEISSSNYPKGFFIYQVLEANSGNIVGSGKIVKID